jgi:hypothetical protein
MPAASPWIWSRRVDIGVFGGSALFALLVAACSGWLSDDGAVPSWAWFVFVLGLDVAHVWTTIFRTYLDPEELSKRPLLYAALPLGIYLAGVALHLDSPLSFWRVLAYAAVFHFMRQQVGWVAIYRARAGERERIDRYLDDAMVYAATGFPVLYWHAHLPRAFQWFVPGDFVTLQGVRLLVGPAAALYLCIALAYAARALMRWRRGLGVNAGKHLVVVTTAAIWYVGIVAANEDFTFTVTNVTVHAVPYMALLWAYSRERARERPRGAVARVVTGGVAAFLAVVLMLAFCEELLWERLVWHDRPGWFGGARRATPLLSDTALNLLVPLLSLPQAVHYALDGIIWRRGGTGAAQARALGFSGPPRAVASSS